jgi:hypothetical protein
MSRAKRYELPEFTFRRQHNGGILIEDVPMESLKLGLLPSHFLIHVEYRDDSSSNVNMEVIHKKSVTDILNFFNAKRNNILKYFCLNERDFENYIKEQKALIVAERSVKSKVQNYVREVS